MRTRTNRWLLAGLVLTLALASNAAADYENSELELYVGEARPFAKFDPSTFDHNPHAHEGFFFTFDVNRLVMEAPKRATIGNTDFAPRQSFIGTLGPVTEFNSLSTGYISDVWHEAQDTTFGYIQDDHGWFFRVFDVFGRDIELTRSDVGVIFADPQNLLIGFYDADGDGTDDSFDGDLNFGRDGGAIDAGDLVLQGVVYGEMHVRNATNMWTVETNYLIRHPREFCGAYWETFCGIRYIQFDEDFDVEGLSGVLADSFWNTEAKNQIIGPQIGVRWFRTNCRWTLSCEARAVAALNFQELNQTVSHGSRLTQIQGAGRGTDITTAPNQLFRSRFDRFAAREVINNEHETEFVQLAEVNATATFNLTEQFALRFGARLMYVKGLARPSGMIDYTFPNMGIEMDENDQRIFMAGGFIGFDFNR